MSLKSFFIPCLFALCTVYAVAIDFEQQANLSLKVPGNNAVDYPLKFEKQTDGTNMLIGATSLPVSISQEYKEVDENDIELTLHITAQEDVYFQYNQTIRVDSDNEHTQFYLPGFWYRRNLRSPEKAPSFHTSQDWTVREDRLSSPLTGVYNETSKKFTTVLRKVEENGTDALSTHNKGEIILSGKTTLGYVGFENSDKGGVKLNFGFPYQETPKSYTRKLTLSPRVRAYQLLKKGETINLTWYVKQGVKESFADFVNTTWEYCYAKLAPESMEEPYSTKRMKDELSNYLLNSYVDKHPVKYNSGVHLVIDKCDNVGIAEVGFVGRTLLNAYNSMEYAVENGRKNLQKQAESVFDSYLKEGFTSNNFFRELINYGVRAHKTDMLSIRRQSEGAYAMLYYLQYERSRGIEHTEWEAKIKTLLESILKLQKEDGSFPRKFNNDMSIVDESGGSTPCAIIPLVMAYTYFKDKRYLEAAKHSAEYLEENLISKADYFSSTLDANCEDKEAAIYAATATYYLAQVTKKKEREHYVNLCRQASYFALTWYYLWDVPFAPGQMLGDVGLKSRGWGNVSVENNHIDVYVFEFASILRFLSREFDAPEYAQMANLMSASMRQLLPVEGNMCGIGKIGYYPEVVQHTAWDYGCNGKGHYNHFFAPGWVIASLWELLSPGRIENYFVETMNKK